MEESFILTVNRAEFLNSYDYEGKRNTFYKILLGNISLTSNASATTSKYPSWQDQYQVDIIDPKQMIIFELYEALAGDQNRLLGAATIKTSEFFIKRDRGLWLNVLSENTQIGSFILYFEKRDHESPADGAKITSNTIKVLSRSPAKKAVVPDKKEEVVLAELPNVTQITREHIMKASSNKQSTKRSGFKDKILGWVGFWNEKSPNAIVQSVDIKPMQNEQKVAKEIFAESTVRISLDKGEKKVGITYSKQNTAPQLVEEEEKIGEPPLKEECTEPLLTERTEQLVKESKIHASHRVLLSNGELYVGSVKTEPIFHVSKDIYKI